MNEFINHTNHSSDRWDGPQRRAAEAYGVIRDLPFPEIPASWGEAEAMQRAEENARACRESLPIHTHSSPCSRRRGSSCCLRAANAMSRNIRMRTGRSSARHSSSFAGFVHIDTLTWCIRTGGTYAGDSCISFAYRARRSLLHVSWKNAAWGFFSSSCSV